jgi:hypothetical protein
MTTGLGLSVPLVRHSYATTRTLSLTGWRESRESGDVPGTGKFAEPYARRSSSRNAPIAVAETDSRPEIWR